MDGINKEFSGDQLYGITDEKNLRPEENAEDSMAGNTHESVRPLTPPLTENDSGGSESGNKAAAGLPTASPVVDQLLSDRGIDPDRLSITFLGKEIISTKFLRYRWFYSIMLGFLLFPSIGPLTVAISAPPIIVALAHLLVGVIILNSSFHALIDATLWIAERFRWSHYLAGTVSEILSTLPELVVIACVAVISPTSAFITVLITIYSNTLLFSFYSFFLPKNHQNKFLMPSPITEAGTQVLVAGGALSITLGLGMLVFSSGGSPKQFFSPPDLIVIALIFLAVFAIYLVKLLRYSADEEASVSQSLLLNEEQKDIRKALVYEHVNREPLLIVILTFCLGALGAWLGGESVSEFAGFALNDFELNPILTAIILVFFAGMGEIIMLHAAHQKKEYGIALSVAFGGITQVMFLLFPVTLLFIAFLQMTSDAVVFPVLEFDITNVLLVLLLFPTFYTLATLIEEDHTLDILDTTVMLGMILLPILLLSAYGG